MMSLIFAQADILPIKFVVWAICIGTNIGYIYLFFSRNVIGGVVRKMLASAVGEDNAKTLSELGYKKFSLFHKILLKDGGILRSFVNVSGGQIPNISNSSEETKVDFDSARFYISIENKDKAEHSYGKPQKWIFLPIFIVLSVAVSAIMALLFPMLFDALSLS
jgi:hypothetical protein